MGVALRTAPLLVIGLALIGCDKAPTANGPGQPRTRVDKQRTRENRPQTEATSNLPTVKLKIPLMS